MESEFIHKIFSISKQDFTSRALAVFRFQYQNNLVYRQFTDALHVNATGVDELCKIPFLPIRFFKTHSVTTTSFEPELVFESSGTTETINSRHLVKDASVYKQSFIAAFTAVYGEPSEWCIIGLLPSYLERKNSSLIMMVDTLIRMSNQRESGFYLNEHEALHSLLLKLEAGKQKTMLIGVTFGLLDFAEKYSMNLNHTIVMETGGMKGRREEWTREQVHEFLRARLGLKTVHSEYGMTELLSQAYSQGEGLFYCPSWMKVLLREEDDPLRVRMANDTSTLKLLSGVINVIDLANVYSCSFIATDDVGKLHSDGGFEVLGRMDNSDIRGCSLMVV